MKVIFLDIDGVLNHYKTLERWEGFLGISPELVQSINAIVAVTKAQVVLSSTWRLNQDYKEALKQAGFNIDTLIDVTPHLGGLPRGHEIHAWLEKHPEVTEYAIIDDDSDMLPHQKAHFFQTSMETGITPTVAKSVMKYLNK